MGLKEKTIAGIIWTGLGTVGSGVIGFVVTIILARYLSPSDFGLIEIILSIVVISEVLIDCGFSQALIKEKNVTQTDLTTVFYLNLIISIVLYLAIYFCAPHIGELYSTGEEFTTILRVLSTKIIIDAIAICQMADCNRKMQFELLAKVSVLSMLASGAIAIVGIFVGCGIWSLVIYYLGLSLGKAILINLAIKWRPTFEFSWARAKKFLSFGSSLMFTQILDKGITSVEALLVGKKYSSTDLGYFSQARKFNSLIIETFMGVIQKVTYPALSQISKESQLRDGYRNIIGVSLFVIAPIAAFCLFFAEEFMVIVFGQQWRPAANFLRLFSIFSIFFPLTSISKNIFMVKDKTKYFMKFAIFKQILRIAAIIITIHYSLMYFTLGIVIVMIISTILFMYGAGKLINYPITRLISDNIKTIFAAFFTVFISLLALPNRDCDIVIFIVKILSVTTLYLITSSLINNNSFIILKEIVVSKLFHKKD